MDNCSPENTRSRNYHGSSLQEKKAKYIIVVIRNFTHENL